MTNVQSDSRFSAAQNFLQMHQTWVDDSDRPEIDTPYREGVEALLVAFVAGDALPEVGALARAVELLSQAYDAWIDGETAQPDDDFWLAISAIEAAMATESPRPLPPLEPLADLRKQQVPDEQICRIYGFVDRYGRVMPWLIDQELKEPGSVVNVTGAIDGRTWEDPRTSQSTLAVSSNPQSETALDLYRQKVTTAQAAKILGQPEDEVQVEFAKFTNVN